MNAHPLPRLLVLWVAAVLNQAIAEDEPRTDHRRPKKLIATGWDMADSERLRANLAEMEQRPFDGVVVRLAGHRGEGKRCPLNWAFLDTPWQREWFQPCVENLQACHFRRFTDNFVLVNANPGNVDWFDDAGWRQIVDHWRIAAWAARASGFKGILFDPEPYAKPHAQFRYDAHPQRDRHSFTQYYAQARERGRQVMQAIAEEFPDITLFCYFLNSVNAPATGPADPRHVLSTLGYGLLPPFIDGWLDVAPPTVTLVDGCESAYRYNSVREYLEAAVLIKGACQELVAPENRAKYRAQVQVSFGIYLDAYWNPKDSEWGAWYVDGKGGPRVERLLENVRTALRVADEYVWVYGEKFRWWPTPNRRVWEKTWPEGLPGCEAALRFARDPEGFARAQLAAPEAAGKVANRARNGGFSAPKATTPEGREVAWKPGRPPAGWSAWQAGDSEGTFTWDRDAQAARAAGVRNGCFLQSYAAEPGQHFAVSARRKLQGEGRAWVRVRWQTADGRWTAVAQDRLFYADGPRGEWGELFGVVRVPEEVGRLVVLLGVGGQASAEDIAWFDDVAVFRVDWRPAAEDDPETP